MIAVKRANIAALFLFVIGLSNMCGYVFHVTALKGIGAALMMAPAPKVFSDVDGLETFASTFTLLANGADSAKPSVVLTPELYSRLHGPYLRRNVYGAALSYAPRLPKELWTPVYCFGFSGTLQRELGIPEIGYDVEIKTNTAGRNDRWLLSVPCS